MKESGFIRQNKEKWERYERITSTKNPDAEELSEVFIEVTDDLSYSRTFYKNRSVRVYLNQLALKVFGDVYKRQPLNGNLIKSFFLDEVPELMYAHRREMLISLTVFLLAATIGVVSSINDPDFAASILSSQYTNMTDQNIANEDPMAVYRSGTAFESFWAIFWNNIRIDLVVYSFGIFFAIGSLFILLFNGVMIGAFQYYFVGTGFFLQSVLTIWLHGTIEISTIVLSGGAGLVTGKGLLFPGTYSRLESFKHSATMGFKLFLAIIPFTLVAAIIEGYVTRQTDAPNWFKAAFIFITLAIVVLYFLVLPYFKCRGKELDYTRRKKDKGIRRKHVKLFRVKPLGEVVGDTFLLMREHVEKWAAFSAIGALVAVLAKVLVRTEAAPLIESSDRFNLIFTRYIGLAQAMDLNQFPMFFVWPLLIVAGITIIMFRNQHKWGVKLPFLEWVRTNLWNLFIPGILLTALFYPMPSWALQLALYQVLFLPIMMAVRSIRVKGHPRSSYSQFWNELIKGFLTKVVRQFFFLFLTFALIAFLGSNYFGSLIQYVVLTFPFSSGTGIFVGSVIQLFVVFFAALFAFGYWLQGVTLMYFSWIEQDQALQLKQELDEAFN